MTGALIFRIIISKLRHQYKPGPVILLKVGKDSKECFHYAVFLFCLPVCLRVEHDRKSSFNAKEVAEQGPELGHKNYSVVTDDRVWEVVMMYYHVDNYFS